MRIQIKYQYGGTEQTVGIYYETLVVSIATLKRFSDYYADDSTMTHWRLVKL